MAWTLQESIQAIKQEYPGYYPYAFVEQDGRYIFSIVLDGESPETAISDIHLVDPKTESVSGSISIMELLKDPGFREKWKHANLVSHHDESLGHSAFPHAPTVNGRGFLNGNSSGYSVRRIRENEPAGQSDTLCHYGISGQKWGVKNGPPYPLDQKTHNRVVKDAQKTSSAGNDQNDGKTGLFLDLIVPYVAVPLIMHKVVIPKILDKRKEKLQQEYNKHNREMSKDLISDIAELDKQFGDSKPPKMIQGKHSVEDDMAAVNPKYAKGTVPGTSNNCTLCSFTYDLRRRGYDVTALSSDSGNYPDKLMTHLYDKPKLERMRAGSFTNLYEDAAKRYPEGARGQISVYGPNMGHSMSWEIQSGKLVVIDSQRNVKVAPHELAELGFQSNNKLTSFIRTDNLNVKSSGINLVAAELKNGWKKAIKGSTASKQKKRIEAVSEKKAAGVQQPMTRAERIRNLEQQWKRDNPNSDNRDAMKNWVEAQMNRS